MGCILQKPIFQNIPGHSKGGFGAFTLATFYLLQKGQAKNIPGSIEHLGPGKKTENQGNNLSKCFECSGSNMDPFGCEGLVLPYLMVHEKQLRTKVVNKITCFFGHCFHRGMGVVYSCVSFLF